jgi:predicted TIM-barrel fold metal-dependent hydrolase
MTITDVSDTAATRATGRYVVVSADCHAGPKVRDYHTFVDPQFRDDFDDYATQVEAYDAGLAAKAAIGSTAMTISDERNQHPGLHNPDERLAVLEADGIAAEVVFPQGAIPFHQYPAVSEPRGKMAYTPRDELRLPGIRAYNRWLAQLCAAHPGRRAGIAVVPIRDIETAVAEARWAKANNLAGISLPVLGDDMTPYNDLCYEPLWAACEELELSLNVHGGAGRYYGTGPTATAMIVAECDWFTRRALWMLIFSGAFERHPRLRLVFTEQRTHWVRPTLDELDSIWRSRMVAVSTVIPKSPSEYFAQCVYVGASFMSPREADARADIGTDRIMWGSDFPHVEGVWPYVRLGYRHTFHAVPEPERRAILGGNAIECYHFDPVLIGRVADRIGPTDDDFVPPTGEPLPEGAAMTWGFRRVGPYD